MKADVVRPRCHVLCKNALFLGAALGVPQLQGCQESSPVQPMTVAEGGSAGAGGAAGSGGSTAGSPPIGGSNSASGGVPTQPPPTENLGGTDQAGGEAAGGTESNAASGAAGAAAAGTAAAGTAGSAGNTALDEPVTRDTLFTIEAHLASDEAATAPGTVGVVVWSVSEGELTDGFVEFGPDESYGTRAPLGSTDKEQRTLLLGLKPNSEYHYRVVVTTEGGNFASDDRSLQTSAAASGVNIATFDILDESAREGGFIVTSYWRGEGSSIVFILDADGDIVWWYDTGANGIARARLSEDGQTMWMISPDNSGGPLQRVSLDTLDAETYSNAIGSHDITPVEGDRMAFLEYGEADCNSIFEITPSEAPREIFETDGLFGADAARCHANALRYSSKEDQYTLSDVSTDIYMIDRDGTLDWSLADTVAGGVQAWGGRNHGHQLLDESIIIFANDGGNGASAVIEYDLEGNEIFRYDSGEASANLGDVQRLPEGNTLITYSNAGIIHEVDESGTPVLKINSGGPSFGYSLWRKTLYGRPPDLDL